MLTVTATGVATLMQVKQEQAPLTRDTCMRQTGRGQAAETPERRAGRWLGALARVGGMPAWAALVLPILGGALRVVQCWLLANVLHRAISQAVPVASLMPDIVGIALVMIARASLGAAGEFLATIAAETAKQRLRQALVDDILRRPPSWTAAQSSGRLAGLVLEQVDAVEGYLSRYVPAVAQAALLPVAFAAIVFPVDWVVGLLFLVTAPLIPVFMALAGWGAEAASRDQADTLARLSGYFADRLRGLVTLKLFGRADDEIAAVRIATDDLRHRTFRVLRIAFLSSAVLEFFAALGVAGVALYVGLTFLDLVSLRGTTLTLEAGLFCLLLAPEVYQPLRLLAAHYHDRAAARAAAAEIGAVLGVLPDPTVVLAVAADPVSAPEAARPLAVLLDGVDVSSPTGVPVVRGAGLSLEAGSHLAIMGESGSGKSTLLEALARLRTWDGTISVGGEDLREMPEPLLRQRVAFLGQRPRIFAGTIADNIRLAQPDACDTAVRLAARRACVTPFADPLPLGLDTPVGEEGLGLSGGEAQRVALARIYLRDPGLVLLDEPTAHLDAATEAQVLDGLLEFAAGRTLIVATHSIAAASRLGRGLRLVNRRLLPALVRPAQRLERRAKAGVA